MRLTATTFVTLLAASAGGFGFEEPARKGHAVLTAPLRLIDDTPYLQVRVNDSAPLWFNLDSGASACVLDKAYCEKVGIPFKGKRQGTGAGAGTVDFFYIEDIRLNVSGLTMKVDQAYGIDLSAAGTPRDVKLMGLLGYDFFRRWIVSIDYPRSLLTLYDPKTFTYGGSGECLPLTFKKKTPYVRGTIHVSGQAPRAIANGWSIPVPATRSTMTCWRRQPGPRSG
jgi:hypothetical protein